MTDQRKDADTNTTGRGTTTDTNSLTISATPVVSQVSVNVGVPGNMKKLVIAGDNPTVADVLSQSGFNANGYDIRMGGNPAQLTTLVTDQSTILLLKAVKGNA
ncbi:hypothetical protein BH11CYA1_BH11CYA1_27240 [soil metagenome]